MLLLCFYAAASAASIRNAVDTDWLKFDANPGVVTIQVLCTPPFGTPDRVRSTLNMQANLSNSQSQVLATRFGIGIRAFTYTVPTKGTYYLSIRGAGNATLTPPYSTYGSIGQYQAILSYPAAVGK
jgi:hypothetical protein